MGGTSVNTKTRFLYHVYYTKTRFSIPYILHENEIFYYYNITRKRDFWLITTNYERITVLLLTKPLLIVPHKILVKEIPAPYNESWLGKTRFPGNNFL